MATVNLDVYCLWQEQRFVTSPTNDAAPVLPQANQGDTWALKIYYLDNTVPRQYHRFVGPPGAWFYAQGNAHIYAAGTVGAEITTGPVAPTVTRTQAADGVGLQEKQKVEFDATSGTFDLTFVAPTYPVNVPTPNWYGVNYGYYITGSVLNIPANASASYIENAINNAIQVWRSFTGSLKDGPFSYGILGDKQKIHVTNWTQGKGFTIEWGQADPSPTQNLYVYAVPLVQIDGSKLSGVYGWNYSLPLTNSDFADVFLPGVAPAFFQVFLNGGLAGSLQLTSPPAVAGAPAFTNGPPTSPASVGDNYQFVCTASGSPPPSFAVTVGALPPGLTLSTGGGIVGVPTAAGSFTGVITATNSAGSASQAFNIVIASGVNNTPPVVGAIYDGSYSVATPHLGLEKQTLIEQQPNSLLYRHKFHQLQSAWQPQALGSVCPYDSAFQLVFETPRIDMGAGIVEWTREWARIPGAWQDAEMVSYPFQQVYDTGQRRGDSSIVYAVVGVSMTRKARVTHTYYSTSDPSTIPVNVMPRVVVLNGYVTNLGNFQNLNYGATTIAQDDEIRHYRGNIWERIERYIKI